MADSYASGDWHVKAGNEEEFLARWREFLEWTRGTADGFGGAVLLRDSSDPNHFVSMAEWASAQAQEGWRSLPDFPQKLGACREVCDEMRGAPFERGIE